MKITKKLVIAATVTAVVAGGGVAFAYWSTTGSGSGTATAGTTAESLTLHTVFDGGLTPGESQTVTVTADNASNGGLNLAGNDLSFTVTTDKDGCTASDFEIAAVAADDVTVAAGAEGTTVGTATLKMLNRDVNQDACKGAVISVAVSAAAAS